MTETIIKPRKGILAMDISGIWHYRELFYIFAWRDIKVRYKQTFFGFAWAIFQPLVNSGIFTIFFGKIAKIPSDGLPYPLFSLAGLVIWNFFSNAVTNSSQSILGNESIIKKVYLPKVIIPMAAIVTAGIDFVISLVLLLIACLFFGYIPQLISLLIFPILVVILFLSTSGIGLFMSALNIKYRDVRYILPFFISMGLFVSPVIYPISIIYDYRKWFLIINPLTSVIETTRAMISGSEINLLLIGVGLIVSTLMFIGGLIYFNKTERFFADIA